VQANTSAEVTEEVRSIAAATRGRGVEASGCADIDGRRAASVASGFDEELKAVSLRLSAAGAY
jgi:hypothetical protein